MVIPRTRGSREGEEGSGGGVHSETGNNGQDEKVC